MNWHLLVFVLGAGLGVLLACGLMIVWTLAAEKLERRRWENGRRP